MNNSELDPDPRSAILERYRRGELTRDQADAEARKFGFSSMEVRPDPPDFDPMIAPLWTLPMTLAWIIYRSPDKVRDLMEDYRARCLFWRARSPLLPGSDAATKFDLLPPKRLNMFEIVKASKNDDPSSLKISGEAACDELWVALKAGDVVAEGVKRGEETHTHISRGSWETLTWRWPKSSSINDDAVYDSDAKPRYTEVRVSTTQVLKLWSDGLPKRPKRQKSAPGRDTTIALIKEIGGDRWSTLTFGKFIKLGKEKSNGCNRSAFNRAHKYMRNEENGTR